MGVMGKRRNEHVYRVRWCRQKWSCQRSAAFLSRRSAEAHRDKIVAAWPNGKNPLTSIEIDCALVRWEETAPVAAMVCATCGDAVEMVQGELVTADGGWPRCFEDQGTIHTVR